MYGKNKWVENTTLAGGSSSPAWGQRQQTGSTIKGKEDLAHHHAEMEIGEEMPMEHEPLGEEMEHEHFDLCFSTDLFLFRNGGFPRR